MGSPVAALVTVPVIRICADAVKPTNSISKNKKDSFFIKINLRISNLIRNLSIQGILKVL
jgi:hypothetical protein